VSYLIAAALGAALAWLWISLIYPAIVEGPGKFASEYRGSLDFGHGPQHLLVLHLRQRGSAVRGRLTFLEGPNTGNVYPVRGRYAEPLLTFQFFPSGNASKSQGTAIFRRRQDGALLSGSFAYYAEEKDAVHTVACDLRRHPGRRALPSPD
jgi:hypothetical protein